jgi:hypothetical protein
LAGSAFDGGQRRQAVGGIEIAAQLADAQVRAVVHLHVAHFALGNLHRNILEEGHEIQFLQHLFVVLHIA